MQSAGQVANLVGRDVEDPKLVRERQGRAVEQSDRSFQSLATRHKDISTESSARTTSTVALSRMMQEAIESENNADDRRKSDARR